MSVSPVHGFVAEYGIPELLARQGLFVVRMHCGICGALHDPFLVRNRVRNGLAVFLHKRPVPFRSLGLRPLVPFDLVLAFPVPFS
jgi:hypothetical protein